jgi:hypothetical protein
MFMLFGCGCLLAMMAALAPRVVLAFMWIVGDRVNAAFDTFVVPLLGLIFAPYTTIMYVLVWNPVGGVKGWDWVWIALGVVLDLMKWGLIGNNRREIPGYDALGIESSEPAAEDTAATAKEPEAAEYSQADELERLAALRDQGVLTDEEFETKKKQLLGL